MAFKNDYHAVAEIFEACAEASVDLCIATSLFTHLDAMMASATMRAIACPAAKRAGIQVDGGARALIANAPSAFSFPHD